MATPLKPSEPPPAAKSSNTDTDGSQLRFLIFVGLLSLTSLVAIILLARSRTDYRALFDQQVEAEWMAGRETVDASEFFAKGGVFENANDRDAQLDQKYVIPLVGRLKNEHHLELQALIDENDQQRACALIARVPADRNSRNAIRATVLQSADEFPGLLYQAWGHQWLSLDFLDEREITPIKQSGALGKLQASQRRME